MSYLPLFPELPESQEPHSRPAVSQGLWLSLPVRTQVEMLMWGLDSRVDPAHPARAIWALAERLTCPNCMSPSAAPRIPLGVLPRTPDALGLVVLGHGRRRWRGPPVGPPLS